MNELRLKRALEERARMIEPSADLFIRVKWEANRRKKEKEKMNFSMKKVIAAVVLVCMICTGCFAASQIGKTILSGSSTDIARYADLEAAAKGIGMNARFVQKFENGYRFASGGVGKNVVQDENGQPVSEEWKSLIVDYRNDAGDYIMLGIEKSAFYELGGIEVTLGYSSGTYKFVPTDYEITAEDEAMIAEGDFNISYGGDDVQLSEVENYSWQDGDLTYSLTAIDIGLGEEEMAAMARQITD